VSECKVLYLEEAHRPDRPDYRPDYRIGERIDDRVHRKLAFLHGREAEETMHEGRLASIHFPAFGTCMGTKP
jgi:hypothetical protein